MRSIVRLLICGVCGVGVLGGGWLFVVVMFVCPSLLTGGVAGVCGVMFDLVGSADPCSCNSIYSGMSSGISIGIISSIVFSSVTSICRVRVIY